MAHLAVPRPARVLDVWILGGLPPGAVLRRLLFFALIVGVVVVSLSATFLAIKWIGRPFAGFLVNERMVLGNIGQYHWTGTEAGLRWPDKIVQANNQPVRSMKDLELVVKQTPLGDPVSYVVDRGGRLIDVAVRTMRFTLADLFMTFGITFLSGLVYFALGVIVFLLKPDTTVSWSFLLACFPLSLFAITSFDIQSTHSGFIRLYLLVNAFFPAAFLHLSLVFPERRKLVQRSPSVQLLPYALSMILVVPLEILYPRPAFLSVYQLVRAYAILSALTMTASTLHAFFQSPSLLARQRAKVVLFGAALAFPLPAVAYYLSLFGGTLVNVTIQNNFLALPILVFPGAVAYAIARHNLFDVDVYIKRAVGYGVITVLVGVGYLSTQTLIRTLVLSPILGDQAEQAYPFLFALLVVFLFNPVNRKVQESVDRIFFRGQLDYKETIAAVSNALTSMLNLDQIVRQVVQTIRREMFVDTVGLLVFEREGPGPRTFFVGDPPEEARGERRPREVLKDVPVAADEPLLALLREEKALLTIYDVAEDPRFVEVKEAYLESFSRMGASLVIPLLYQAEMTGVLALGRKKSGHFYSREDIDLLTTMTNQAAVAIKNATTHEDVVRYADELAQSLRRIQILESIKTNLAKFVPRTVQALIEESPEAPLLDKREADVSVVFADITGYTRLSAQMELDQVNRLVERYFGAFLDEILKYGGDVNETAGDGLMVIFQDPDPARHARAAVLAALAIQRRTREINVELRGQSEPIMMHVGVNSGIAAVGATKIEGAAGTRWTYTASGPTTNLASRLAGVGEGGAVVLSEETRRRLGDEFLAEDLGLQSLKNVAQPIRAFRLPGNEGLGTEATG